MLDALLIAWGPFANAWMLSWAAAALVPLLIHLLHRRTRREVDWAAMQFLLAAVHKRSRRLSIEQWILLVIRIAAVVLFALALADPFLSATPASVPGQSAGRTHTVLVLDGSFSMAARMGRLTSFESARQNALEFLQAGSQGDGYTLMMICDPPRIVVSDAVFDRRDMAAEVETLEVQHTVRGLSATLLEIERTIDRVERRHPRLTSHQVVFFTDLGQATWQEVANGNVRDQLGRLAKKARLSVISAAYSPPQNLTITGLIAPHRLPTVQDRVPLQVSVRNFGLRVAETRLELFANDRSISQQEIELPAGAETTVPITHRFVTPGQHVIEARIGDDDLNIDNHRWLTIDVPESLRVLCVEGHQGAAEFVAVALAAGTLRKVEPTVVGESSLVEAELRDYHCVVLCNVGRFQESDARLLDQYVRQGGGLIMVLGDRVQDQNYNLVFGEQTALMPARLEGVASGNVVRFDPLDYEHPVVAPFRGHERAGLLTTPTWSYQRLRPYGASTEVVMDFSDGQPAMLTAPVGQGRVTLFATSVAPPPAHTDRPPWSGLPISPCFPPLIHEAVHHVVEGQQQRQNILVGELISGLAPRGFASGRLTLETPGGARQSLPVDFGAGSPRWTFEETYVSGVYQVIAERPGSLPQHFAVNVDESESSLRQLDATSLPSQLRPHDGSDRLLEKDPSQPPDRSLFRRLLTLVLILLVSESALAKWISRGHD